MCFLPCSNNPTASIRHVAALQQIAAIDARSCCGVVAAPSWRCVVLLQPRQHFGRSQGGLCSGSFVKTMEAMRQCLTCLSHLHITHGMEGLGSAEPGFGVQGLDDRALGRV